MKTPKEKATELVEKLKWYCDGTAMGAFRSEVAKSNAKQCAIIAIDEMIIQNGEAYLLFKIHKDYYQEMNGYLFQVKQEIEKL